VDCSGAMELNQYKDPSTKETIITVRVSYEEVLRAYTEMHAVHRQILDMYFKEDSPISDILFGISEIAKVLEDLLASETEK
jgi:hypothetical protein